MADKDSYIDQKRQGSSLLRVGFVVLLGVFLLSFVQGVHAETGLYLLNNPNEDVIPPTTFAIYRLNPEMNQATRIYSRYFDVKSYSDSPSQKTTVLDGVNKVLIHPNKEWALLFGNKSIIHYSPQESFASRKREQRGWLRIYDFKQEKFVEEYILPEEILLRNYFYNTLDGKLLLRQLKVVIFGIADMGISEVFYDPLG